MKATPFPIAAEALPYSVHDARLAHVDIAKGMAMAAIVAIHNPLLLVHGGRMFNALLSFALPVFFISTGMFTQPGKTLCASVITRTRALILPYVATIVGIALIRCVIAPHAAAATLWGGIFGTGATLVWVTLWFLPHLWIVSIATLIAIRWIERCRAPRLLLVLLATILWCTGAGCLHLMNASSSALAARGLPFSIDVLPISLAYALAGYAFREVWLRARVNVFLLMPAALCFVLLQFGPPAAMDLNLRRYDSSLWSTASALSGTYAVFGLAALLRGIRYVGSFVRRLGHASLVVCIFHFPIQQALVAHLAGVAPLVLSALALGMSMLMWRCMSASPSCRLLFAIPAPRRSALRVPLPMSSVKNA